MEGDSTSYGRAIESLESEWAAEIGFFWRVRQGDFVSSDFERALGKVKDISVEEDAALPRRLISLLWYIPLFMEWQSARVDAKQGDGHAYGKAVVQMTNEIERLLGVP